MDIPFRSDVVTAITNPVDSPPILPSPIACNDVANRLGLETRPYSDPCGNTECRNGGQEQTYRCLLQIFTIFIDNHKSVRTHKCDSHSCAMPGRGMGVKVGERDENKGEGERRVEAATTGASKGRQRRERIMRRYFGGAKGDFRHPMSPV